eukprot:346289-Chlamydomonas_euryale.AAC.1
MFACLVAGMHACLLAGWLAGWLACWHALLLAGWHACLASAPASHHRTYWKMLACCMHPPQHTCKYPHLTTHTHMHERSHPMLWPALGTAQLHICHECLTPLQQTAN